MKINLDPRTLPEARTELQRVSDEATKLENQISVIPKVEDSEQFKGLQNSLKVAEEAKVTAENKVTDLTTQLGTVQGELATAKTGLSTAEAKVAKLPELAEEKAIELIAAKGLGPLKVGGGELEGGDKKKSELKGTARAAAAWANVGKASTN